MLPSGIWSRSSVRTTLGCSMDTCTCASRRSRAISLASLRGGAAQHLDRHLRAERDVLGRVHDADAAGADLARDAVLAAERPCPPDRRARPTIRPSTTSPRSSAAMRCLSSVRAARSRLRRLESAPITLPSVAPMPAAMPIASRPPDIATAPAEITAPVPAARYGLHGEVSAFHVTTYGARASPFARQLRARSSRRADPRIAASS